MNTKLKKLIQMVQDRTLLLPNDEDFGRAVTAWSQTGPIDVVNLGYYIRIDDVLNVRPMLATRYFGQDNPGESMGKQVLIVGSLRDHRALRNDFSDLIDELPRAASSLFPRDYADWDLIPYRRKIRISRLVKELPELGPICDHSPERTDLSLAFQFLALGKMLGFWELALPEEKNSYALTDSFVEGVLKNPASIHLYARPSVTLRRESIPVLVKALASS